MAEQWQVLEISDGTTSIDLLRGPIKVVKWRPSIASYKDSGVWSDSPFDDGKELVSTRYDNGIETFDTVLSARSQNSAIYTLRQLRQLLKKAEQYKTTKWQTGVVWLEARAQKETVSRYARIKAGSLPEDDEIFGVDFAEGRNQHVIMKGLTLVIMREPLWLSDKPGNSTAIQISSQQTYNGITYGRSATSLPEVYAANKHNQSNITHLFVYDASVPSYTANLIGSALPYYLLPAVPAVGDICYIGTNTALANSGPFDSLVFDLLQAQVDLNLTWEYWNGAWVALTTTDLTTGTAGYSPALIFAATGVHSVHWIVPSDWVTTAVNGITGYWLRARITSIGAGPTPARQQNRDPYSIVVPFVQIDSAQIPGDEAALAKVVIYNVGSKNPGSGAPLESNEVFCGLRSVSRGANFTPYLNFSDEQNPTGITVGVGTACAFGNDVQSPTGRIITFTPTGAGTYVNRAGITLSAALFSEYFGSFHVFLRCRQTAGSVGDIGVYFQLSRVGYGANAFFTSETKYTTMVSATGMDVLDFGLLTIPGPQESMGDTWGATSIQIAFTNSNAANPPLRLFDIVLMPVDEWSVECVDPVLANYSGLEADTLDQRELVIDGINPKRNRGSFTRGHTSQETVLSFTTRQAGPPMLQYDATQKLFFFQKRYSSGWFSRFELADLITVSKTSRYLSGRGTT